MADIDAQADLYATDFAAWADRQSALARAGEAMQLDLAHIADELEALSARERRELRRRLSRLMQHLLKWAYQPDAQSRSWETTIAIQRSDIADILRDSPSLRPAVEDAIADSFRLARQWAITETGLLRLPERCPWTSGQILSTDFLPATPNARS